MERLDEGQARFPGDARSDHHEHVRCDDATDDERAVLQGCIDGAGSLLTMGEVDAKSTVCHELRTALEDAKREALEAAAAEAEAAVLPQASYYNAGYTSSYASAASCANGSGLTRSAGVNNYNGRRETYYSSNVLYHYRTGEWTQDSEGFWRDSDGYYVVAAGDMAQGFSPLRAPRVIARSMTPAALPEPPTTTPVGNFSASRIFGGRASLPSFRAT